MEFDEFDFAAINDEHNAAMAAPSDDEVQIIEDDQLAAEGLHPPHLLPHEQLAAEEPFDVAYVHEHQRIDDPVPQREVLAAIQRETNATGNKDYAMTFNAMRTQVRRLSTLKRFVESQREGHAIALLRERSRIVIDNQFLLETSHHDVIPHVKEHFVDFVLYMGNRIGLDALLPPQHILVNHVFFLTWNFHQRNRLWPGSVGAHFPFSVTGRMICMGKRFQEEFWIAFPPRVLLEHDDLHHPPPHAELMAPLDAPSSALLPRHQNMFIMFLGFIFARLRIQDIVCNGRYPEPLTSQTVRASTNILGRLGENGGRSIELTLDIVREIDEAMRRHWDTWVEGAPASWKEDGFLLDTVPIAITKRYGQNQRIMVAHAERQERDNWDRDHDFTHLRTVVISIASHLQFLQAEGWDVGDFTPENLIRRHPRLFDRTNDDDDRVEVNLHTLPLLDENNQEIPVYDEEGYRIRRRFPVLTPGMEYGALVNLTRVHELFPPDGHHSTFDPYPLGFTKIYGNIQARRTMQPYDKVIEEISATLGTIDDDNEMEDLNVHRTPIVKGTYCQMYNQISHRVRDQARFHPVQLGLTTTMFAGTTATSRKNKNRFERLRQHSVEGLPQDRYNQAIGEGIQGEALRIEQSFVIEVHKLPQNRRNGRTLYDEVLKPLCRRLTHPTVMSPLKESIQAFQPQASQPPKKIFGKLKPSSLIKWMWNERHRFHGFENNADVSPYDIEFMAMLERSLNYGHTGSGKVLSRKLMDRSYLSLGIVQDGFPCISDKFLSFGDLTLRRVTLHTSQWPFDNITMRPLTCSKRAQELTYDDKHYQSYEAMFTIRHAIAYMPEDSFKTIANEDIRHACCALDVAVKTFIHETKNFVFQKVSEQVLPDLGSQDINRATIARRRHDSLDLWMGEPKPLSTNGNTLVHLIRAINPGGEHNQVTSMSLKLTAANINGQSSQPLDFLLDIILMLSKIPTKRSAPPFLQKGVSLTVFRTAFTEVSKMLISRGFNQSPVDNVVRQGLAHIFTVKGINHVPWSANPVQGQNGRPSSQIVHHVWLSLGAPSRSSSIKPNSSFLSADDANILFAAQASADMSLKDCRADWTAADVRLIEYYQYLHKMVLPVEWHLESSSFAQPSNLILSVYNWVSHNFNSSNPLHALALFIAFIFAGLLPCVDHEEFVNKPSTFTGPQFMAYITNLDWIEPKRKGVREISPFITMVTAFIIALGDSNCPDWNVFQKGKASSHSVYSDKELKDFLSKHTSKGITLFNVFVRFKLANAHSLKIWKAAQWGVDVRLKSKSQLTDLWSEVKDRLLQGKEFGGYNAVVFLAGEKTARKLLEKEWVKTRGMVMPMPITRSEPSSSSSSSRFLQGSSSSSLGKRRQQYSDLEVLEIDDDDDDDDDIIDFEALARAGPSSRRRPRYG